MFDTQVITAHHEAAHATVLYRASGHVGGPINIVPRIDLNQLGSHSDGVSDSLCPEHIEGHILSCYAGGHAQRKVGPSTNSDGCESDDAMAGEWLERWGWEERESELRDRSRQLVEDHWAEISATADEVLRLKALDDAEIELIADGVVSGEGLADVEEYRARFGPRISKWREAVINRGDS